MAYLIKHHRPPQPWHEFVPQGTSKLLRPCYRFDWCFKHLAYHLSHWSFLEVLEYVGSLSILLAVIFWFLESGERTQQKHYQAWQVINTAQGKGGSGGRIDALEQLNADGVPLVGVDVSEAFLQNVHLDRAELARANFNAADLRGARFVDAKLTDADLNSANLRGADLRTADLSRSDLDEADFVDADLGGAHLTGVSLEKADLRGANLANVVDWHSIKVIKQANVHGVRNAPEGFLKWAKEQGAIDQEVTEK